MEKSAERPTMTCPDPIPLTSSFKPVAYSKWTGLPMENFDDDSDAIFPPDTEIPLWHQDGKDTDNMWLDGAGYRSHKPGVSAVFIHAGAGYHSTTNEKMHLEACSEAARAAMRVLRDGQSAVDAVEVAIKVLEDKEITNAGYGSNLSIDGTVECDATIVDHLGRSGACGAVPNIKNPIGLAKLILKRSSQPLSLRRVPPNLLIGDGAKEFAWQQGMSLVPNEWLVSRNAKDRFNRWQDDLKRAEGRGAPPTPTKKPIPEYADEARQKAQRDHTNAILTGTWNEGQPDSPGQPSTPFDNVPHLSPVSNGPISPRRSPQAHERSPLSFLGATTPLKNSQTRSSSIGPPHIGSPQPGSPARKRQRFMARAGASSPQNSDGGHPDEMDTGNGAHSEREDDSHQTPLRQTWIGGPSSHSNRCASLNGRHFSHDSPEDKITDTVGAIAIDADGLMAAGSSSGGIGMKHRGRVGPAALVGIGTAIIPADNEDRDKVVVGAVTSGTGEHMATTMASQKCAERLYHGTVRAEGGGDIKEDDENAILEGFIIGDFELHPGVKYSSSASAIGVMSVKKTPRGYYLYFAHNTDSFALASMSSNDRNPHCVMSRLNEGGKKIAQGARKISVS